MGLKRWHIRQLNIEAQAEISAALGLGSLAAGTLAVRGYTAEDAAGLISGDERLHDPYLLKDMDKAVARVRKALSEQQTIAIFGDYDCDGITATAMLYSYLEMMGAQIYYYIPRREAEGYGLNTAAIDRLHGLGVELIITVDNGVSAIDEVAHAAALGIDIVVTDHHQPREILPKAAAIVNPHRADCEYPFKGLSGAGVAFKLICALEDEIGYETLEHFADLLAIGTVADAVSLTGENRMLVREGLVHLAQCMRPGIAALIEHLRLEGKRLTAESIAFALAPRLNAAGRVGEPDTAVMLFLAEDEEEAARYCTKLEDFNEQRKESEARITDEVRAMLLADPALLTRRILALYSEGWSSGTVGILCSRLVDHYEKPCLLISVEGEEARGSGRSLPGFSLIDAVTSGAHLLSRYGGHLQAAGFTMPTENVPAFIEAVESYAATNYPVMPTGSLWADCEICPEDLTLQGVTELEWLEPFGTDNETPLYVMRRLKLERILPTADGRHVRIVLNGGGQEMTAVYFGMPMVRLGLLPGDMVDIIFTTDVNLWNDKRSVNIKIKDMHISGVDIDALADDREQYYSHLRGAILPGEALPTREDVAVLYRAVRAGEGIFADRDALACRMWKSGLGYTRAALAADVLCELSLIHTEETEQGPMLRITPGPAKVNLDDSAILSRHRSSEATP